MSNILKTDVTVVGGGITSGALNYQLSNVKGGIRSIIVEKQTMVGQMNTGSKKNSQTPHEGDIESNYIVEEKIKQNKRAAGMLLSFFDRFPEETSGLRTKMGKMLFAAGESEVELVKKRYQRLTVEKKIFPNNVLLNREQIKEIEPALVTGRDPNEPIAAYYSPDGYAVDFEATTKKMFEIAQRLRGDLTQVLLGVGVKKIECKSSEGDLFHTHLDDGRIIESKAVIVNAGSYTPVLMKQLGYGDDVGILSIGAIYYYIKSEAQERLRIRNKIYTVQEEGLPNAAIHLDPEVNNPDKIRFGPTAFGIPYLENGKRNSILDYIGILKFKDDFKTFLNIMKNKRIRNYVMRNYLYLLPFIGKSLFAQDNTKIIPLLKSSDLEASPIRGGNRSQSTNRKSNTINFGETRIVGNDKNIILNTTASPGATGALLNTTRDILTLLNMKGFEEFEFDSEAFYEQNGFYAEELIEE